MKNELNIKDLLEDLNVTEIKAHDTDESLSCFLNAWKAELLDRIYEYEHPKKQEQSEPFTIDFLSGMITFKSEDGESLAVSSVFVRAAYHAWERQMTYRSDVIERIEELINDGVYPEEALKNETFISAALDEYDELRSDDSEEVEAKLDETFEAISYEGYAKEG